MLERDFSQGMSVAEVRAWVEHVRVLAVEEDDNESAHTSEDKLLVAVLQAIAGDGRSAACDAAELAAEALKVCTIDYSRWHS